jgi:hypothetical protein
VFRDRASVKISKSLWEVIKKIIITIDSVMEMMTFLHPRRKKVGVSTHFMMWKFN